MSALEKTDARQADIVVIGGGLAGSSAATALSRKGYSVVLISAHDRHPPDFRAEKIGPSQMALFERIGLGEAALSQMTPFDGVWIHRYGRIIHRATAREYASDYSDLVNALRRAIPSDVSSVTGKVDDIEAGPERQSVTLSDGRRFTARLLVVATGLGDTIRRKLAIEREVFSPAHSLCCGFNLARPASDFPFPSLVWNSARFEDRLSYLTLFPIGETMRANLFVYRSFSEEWTQTFRKQPQQSLAALMPDLPRLFGEIALSGPVTARPIDLVRVKNHERDGVVLIGDAFSVVCPITGTGIDKALTDVDRLSDVHVPQWFSSPGMGADKIAQFYADPVKIARDASALEMSLRARNIKIDPHLYWKIRRLRSDTLGRGRALLRQAMERLRAP